MSPTEEVLVEVVKVVPAIIGRVESKLDKVLEQQSTHEGRIRHLEHKLTWKNVVVSALVAVATALVATMASGCYSPPATFPSKPEMVRADKATVLIKSTSWQGSFMATGWFNSPDHLVTAGHVCNNDSLYTITTFDEHTALAYPLLDSDTNPYDICVMQVLGYESATTLEMADKPPEMWDPVYYVGYPQGLLTVQRGTFVGYHRGFVRVAIPGYMGASGSALIGRDGKVYGVLSYHYSYDFNNIMFAPTNILESE